MSCRWLIAVVIALTLGICEHTAERCLADDAGSAIMQAALPLERSEYRFRPNVVYGRKFGMALTYDVFAPSKNANGAGVIFVVSGGWISDRDAGARFYGPSVAEMVKRGYTIFTVCHGCQPKFTIDEIVGDIDRSVRYIRLHAVDYKISPDRIGISGGSAGGHLSLMQGVGGKAGDPKSGDPLARVSSRVQAVACFFPPTDFLNYGGKGKYAFAPGGTLVWLAAAADFHRFDPHTFRFERITDETKILELARTISPLDRITADTPPTLIIHGDADKLVPIEQSKEFIAKLKELGIPAQLVVKHGAGHGRPGLEKDVGSIADWYDKYLSKK
jgi:acetyl esterase/lipase